MCISENTIIGIIGTGNMGTAIIKGLLNNIAPQQISCFDIDKSKIDVLIDQFGISPAPSIDHIAKKSNILLFAVKPGLLPAILKQCKSNLSKNTILVSIAAGIPITTIEKNTNTTQPIVRVMPNTPALIGEGMTVLSPNAHINNDDIKIIEKIFSCIGKVLTLPESNMDAVTALSGSGPAYVFTFLQALVDAGVKMGIPRDKALILASQTIIGSTKLVLETGDDPISLRGKVTSPGGTTIEAVHILERAGFSGIIIDAVDAATKKSKKLGE